MSFLDCNGALIPYAYEAWRDEGRDKQSKNKSFNSDRPWFFFYLLNAYIISYRFSSLSFRGQRSTISRVFSLPKFP